MLTKSTGLFLAAAVLYQLTATLGRTRRGSVKPVAVVVGTAIVLWLAYYALLVRPHYLDDYRLLFAINRYRVHLSIVLKVAFNTLWDGMWIDRVVFPAALVVLVLSLTWLRELWRVPLFGSSVVAVVGYMTFICYHGNLQPRYYLVVSMPVVIVLVLGLETLWERRRGLGWGLCGAVGLVMVAMMVHTVRYAIHPEYSLATAADSIAAQMRADTSARQILVSGTAANVTLLTGVPSLCPYYTTHGLDPVLDQYKPGWYAAWKPLEDDNVKTLRERYRLVEKAHYRVFDDPGRQVLVLYRMEKL